MKDETTGTKIVSIGKDIEYIKRDVSEIKDSVKDLSSIYATKIAVEAGNKEIEERLRRIEGSNALWRWLSPTLAAIVGSVLTFLIIQYLQHL